ncbi:MFS transporter [Streptomyces sp. DH12]|uniref:MFS transporter n=1 Tax=Streptomyces sp. DH12 TaxID=2857010 RepID=UPI001E3A2A38|nr:MFS transporter [Streptomyces sp. DH12]
MNRERFLPALLVVALIGTIIELDMSVPSFPGITRELGASESAVQLTVTVNFLGYCLGALAHGPLSDRFGRRGVMLAGNTVMLVGALGCAVAPGIGFLLGSRFVQGVGASTSVVLVFVIIADVYEGARLLRMYGLTNAAMSAFMTAAPALGGMVDRTLGWRGNYAVVFAVTLVSLLLMVVYLPETRAERVEVSARQVAGDYRRLLRSGRFVAASLAPSLLFAGYMVFIATGSFLYTDTFGLSATAFAGHLLVVVACFAVTSLLAARITALLGGPGRTVVCGTAATVAGAALFLALGDGPLSTTAPLALFCVGFATVHPVVFARSLQVLPELRGAASSLNMSARALLVAVSTGAASGLFTGDPVVTAGAMAVATAVAAPPALLALRGHPAAGERAAPRPDAVTGADRAGPSTGGSLKARRSGAAGRCSRVPRKR